MLVSMRALGGALLALVVFAGFSTLPVSAEDAAPSGATPAAAAPGAPNAAGGPAAGAGGAAAPADDEPYQRRSSMPDPDISVAPPLSDQHPLVRDLVEANPGKDVIICVAGCGPKPTVVSSRATTKNASKTTVGEHVPTSSVVAQDADTAAPPPSNGERLVCVAGCEGKD